MSREKNRTRLFRSKEELTVNPNGFSIEYLACYNLRCLICFFQHTLCSAFLGNKKCIFVVHFWATRVLFLLLNFQKSRNFAVNQCLDNYLSRWVLTKQLRSKFICFKHRKYSVLLCSIYTYEIVPFSYKNRKFIG